MLLIKSILLLTSLIGLALAATIPPPNLRIPFKTRRSVRSDHVVAGIQVLTDNVEYYATIDIGSPPQSFDVILDTGSVYLWVVGRNCTDPVNCNNNRFDETRSATYQPSNTTMTAFYGDGSAAAGPYATDVVRLGGLALKQGFSAVYNANKQFVDMPQDVVKAEGILGLGLQTPANNLLDVPYTPFVLNLANQGLIANPVFSIYLTADQGNGAAGELVLGGVDGTKMKANAEFVPLSTFTTFDFPTWHVNTQNISVVDAANNQAPIALPARVVPTLLDTGASGSYMDADIVVQIVASLNGQKPAAPDSTSGLFVVDCNFPTTISVRFSFSHDAGGGEVDAKPVNIDIPLANLVTKDTAGTCYFNIHPANSATNTLGNDILSKLYIVYDMGNQRVGFAASVGSSVIVSS